MGAAKRADPARADRQQVSVSATDETISALDACVDRWGATRATWAKKAIEIGVASLLADLAKVRK